LLISFPPPFVSISEFLTFGVQPWARKHGLLPQSPVFISFACDSDPGPRRDLLLATLQRLQKDLTAAGITVLLDTTRTTDSAWVCRAEDVMRNTCFVVVCTPELKRQAMEGRPGIMPQAELLRIADRLGPSATPTELELLLTAEGLNSLQRELWFIVRQVKAGKAGVLLLQQEGSWDSSVPGNFFADRTFVVCDMRPPAADADLFAAHEKSLIQPGGLLGRLFDKQPFATVVRAAYDSMLQRHGDSGLPPSSTAPSRGSTVCRQEQLRSFYQPLCCQASKDSHVQRLDLQDMSFLLAAADIARNSLACRT
jgi:hypothetical protein